MVSETIRALQSVLMNRWQFFRQDGMTFGGLRDLYQICGYKRVITVSDYRDRYARGGVAGRIIDALPNACWRGEMTLTENDDPKSTTPFEKAWSDLQKRLKVQKQFLRVDKLSRISTYAVLFIGAPGDDLSQELPRASGPDQLLYLQPFIGGGGPGDFRVETSGASGPLAFGDAQVYTYETDPTNPRFGQPATYRLRRWSTADPMLMRSIHWSRIIHVPSENALDDDVFGQPALERVWNKLDDLDKVTGGGAEAFWIRANGGLHLDLDKDVTFAQPKPGEKSELDRVSEQAEDYVHQQARVLRTRGITVSQLGSDVANFGPPADAILTQIAGATGMPKRILTGSEMGELASSQDRDNWKDQVDGRQSQRCAPDIVRQTADRLIAYGYLPAPSKGVDSYEVVWPHMQVLTEQEKAAGAQSWAETNKAQGVTVFTDDEVRDHWYGFPPLTPEQKIAVAAPERVSVAEPAAADPNVTPPAKEPKAPKVPEPPAETLRALEAALEENDTDTIDRLLGIERHTVTIRKTIEYDDVGGHKRPVAIVEERG